MRRVLSMAVVAAALPIGLWKAAPAGAEEPGTTSGVQISPSDSRPAAPGPSETFTGNVSVTPLFDTNEVRTFSSAQVAFQPGARTAWHTHPAGQTLVVTEGTGWVQEWGGPRQQMNTGDVVWIEPGVKHWHGAASDTAMTHIAIQAFVDGTPVDWMEQVADDQYSN